jgi:hypothetical protein
MKNPAIVSSISTLEGLFGTQAEQALAAETKALSDALGASLTDEEIAKSAAAERKLVFAGARKAFGG